MHKYLTVACLAALIAIIYVNPALPGQSYAQNGEDPVCRAFHRAEADLQELNVQAWAQLKYPTISSGEMLEVLKAVSAEVVPEVVLSYIPKAEGRWRGIALSGEMDPAREYYSTIQTYQSPEGLSTTYILLNYTARCADDPAIWRAKLGQALRNLEAKPHLSVYLTGTLPEKLSRERQEELILQMFREVKAYQVEGIAEEELLSVSGFTPLIQEKLKVNGRNINLNIAINYNEIEGLTCIRVGSPLLKGEY